MHITRYFITSIAKSSLIVFGLCLLFLLKMPLALAEQHNEAATTKVDNREVTGSTSPVSSEDNPQRQEKPESGSASQIEGSMANIELIQQTLEALRDELANSKETTSLNSQNVKIIRDGIALIEEQLKEAYSGLDESRKGVAMNTENITTLTEDLLNAIRNIKANTNDLSSQKSLIEDNSIRLYEILIQISTIDEKVNQFKENLESIRTSGHEDDLKRIINNDLNRLWMLLAIVLVFITPVAFALSSNRENYKPLVDGIPQHQGVILACLGGFLGYFIVGFGFMHGDSSGGLIGSTSYLVESTTRDTDSVIPFNEFILYQSGLILLAVMIVYAAVGRQLSSTAHLVLAILGGAIVLPVFGHWVWSGHFISGNNGWLESIGFIDEAGSITINAVAAWFAFIIVWKLGQSTPPQPLNKESDDPVYSSSAILLLWVSWMGITAGHLPIGDAQLSSVVLNVGLAGTTGGIVAFVQYSFFHSDKGRITRALGGFASGLVAIAACAQSVTSSEALAIGAIAGLLHNVTYNLLRRIILKQNWQARSAQLVSIHGFSGILGAVSLALFGTEGNFSSPNLPQLLIQTQGIAAALVYSIIMGYSVTFLLMFRRKNPQTA